MGRWSSGYDAALTGASSPKQGRGREFERSRARSTSAILPWPTMLRCSRSLVRSRMSAFRLGSKGLSSAMKEESRRPGFKTLRRGTQVPLLMGISSPPVAILQTLFGFANCSGRSGGSCRSLEVPAGAPTIFKV